MIGLMSFWSEPFQKSPKNNLESLLMWVLSFHKIKGMFHKVILVTDDAGNELLINKLKLPFTQVLIELNDFVPKEVRHIWALGKIKAYSLMQDPFLHVDSDVFLMNPVPHRITGADMCAQSTDAFEGKESDTYKLSEFLDKNIIFPDYYWMQALSRNVHRPPNCGIFGGENTELINEYATGVLSLVSNPQNILQNCNGTRWSVLLEQYGAFVYAASRGIKIETLLSSASEEEAVKNGYVHLHGEAKFNPYALERLHCIVRTEYLEYYARCEQVFEKI